MEGAIDFARAEEILLRGAFVDSQPVWRSSNYVFVCRLEAGGDEVLAVYKPRRGETPLWDFPQGTLFRREVAAYRLANLLGWPIVPPTVVRDGPEGPGSLQLFVEHDPNAHFFVLREEEALLPQLKRMAAFDVVANNADRKGGHCLLDPQGIIWGIDHGICFHSQYKLRTVMWDWADEPVPDDVLEDIARLGACLEHDRAAIAALEDVLDPEEIAAAAARARGLAERGCFPSPGPHRPYPWPLI